MTPQERSELAKVVEVLQLLVHELRALGSAVAEELERLRDRVDERGAL